MTILGFTIVVDTRIVKVVLHQLVVGGFTILINIAMMMRPLLTTVYKNETTMG